MIRRILPTTVLLFACSPLFAQAVPQIPTPITDARNAFLDAHPNTGFTEIGTLVERVWGRTFSTGNTPIASVQRFVDRHAGIWGATTAQLAPVGPFADGAHTLPLMYDADSDSYAFTGVFYSQQVGNIPVFRAHLVGLVRNEAGFPMVLAGSSLRDVSSLEAQLKANAPKMPNASVYTRSALNQFRAPPRVSDPTLVIWAGIDDEVVEPRLAVRFDAEGGSHLDPANFMHMLYVVDATDGRVLFQENLIYHADVSGTVQGNATVGTKADNCASEAPAALPYAKVTSAAGTHYADVNGNFVIPWPNAGALNVTSTMAGLFFYVSSDSGGDLSLINAIPSGGTSGFIHNGLNLSDQDVAQVNAYIHANIARDSILAANPNYPTIAGQADFPINVNIANSCNAFYNNSTINFYLAGGGCPNTAFSSVVHHEYGHHMVAAGGSGQGAYGEGMSDCLAVSITDENLLGIGFQGNCNAGLRDANNTCQYQAAGCSSCGSAVHACGRLISGCIWDLRMNLSLAYPTTYKQRLASLVVNSVPLHAGLSSITPGITVDFLTLNDDNGDITDGTPDYEAINAAFSLHNMPGPAVLPIKFNFPNGLPALTSPAGTTTIAVSVAPLGGTPVAGSGKLFYRVGNAGAFTQVAMPQGLANQYLATLPAAPCGSTLQYYFAANAVGGATVTSPSTAPTALYSAPIAYSQTVAWSDDFETNKGWSLGVAGDTATAGLWVRNDPVGSAAQPENDRTVDPGTNCAFTGQGTPGGSLGAADLDNGITTLMSPSFGTFGSDDLFFTAWVWYSNDKGSNPGQDTLPVQVSNNGGTTWVTMQTISTSTTSWVQYSWRLADHVALSENMRVRFRAQDTDPQSLVEVAVDDVAIIGSSCTALIVGDLNGDGIVDGLDLAIVLGNWGNAGLGDLNGDGNVDGLDIAILLGNWS